jgi:hypothetical protein
MEDQKRCLQMRRRLVALAILLLIAIPASAELFLDRPLGGRGRFTYSDFCSQSEIVSGGGCTYAFSVRGRLVSTNASPGTLTRFSDSATHTVTYAGPSFKVNVADATSFCLGNSGTTSTITVPNGLSATQYNDCGWSRVVDQNGSGCKPTQATRTNMPFFQVRVVDGESALVQTIRGNSVTASGSFGSRWLFATGCTKISGTGPKTLVELTNNAYFSGCCGLFGAGETVPHAVPGTMYAGAVYTTGGQHFWLIDGEAGGTCQHGSSAISVSPVIDSVGIGTFGGSGNPLSNYWWNNVQTAQTTRFSSQSTPKRA